MDLKTLHLVLGRRFCDRMLLPDNRVTRDGARGNVPTKKARGLVAAPKKLVGGKRLRIFWSNTVFHQIEARAAIFLEGWFGGPWLQAEGFNMNKATGPNSNPQSSRISPGNPLRQFSSSFRASEWYLETKIWEYNVSEPEMPMISTCPNARRFAKDSIRYHFSM